MKQDFFTRDKGKLVDRKKVGSDVRLTPSQKFKREMAKKIKNK